MKSTISHQDIFGLIIDKYKLFDISLISFIYLGPWKPFELQCS